MTTELAVLRVRGSMETKGKVEHAIRLMRLTRKNHVVFVKHSQALMGSLQLCKDFLTWGEVTAETIATLVEKRGQIVGNKPITAEYLSKNSKFKSFKELGEAIAAGTATLSDVKGLTPVLRLNPPRKGFEGSIKRPFPEGALGKRGADINQLLLRMV